MANGLFNLKQVMQAVQQGGWPAQRTPSVEYLVVAGGGGANNGGGGAGGLLQGIEPVPNSQTLLVTVGGGGAGTNTASAGANGQNSVFGNITATGGGGGGSQATGSGGSGSDGGSGGGQGFGRVTNANYVAGQGVVGQGNAGSLGYSDLTTFTKGGGGGGAGTPSLFAGQNGNGGNGGTGIASSINGTVTTYAGGGGGGPGNGNTAGTGGVGGGGAGVYSGTANNGAPNTGGGAGGGNQVIGGTGGSGIVIVSYPDVYAAATSAPGATVSTSGSGAIAFSSSGNIRYAGQSAFAFGTGDFTIEGWFYVTTLAGGAIAWDFRNTGATGGTFPTLELSANGQVQYVTNSAYVISSSVGLNTVNTWAHIVIARSGTVTKLFFNGTQAGSSYTDTTNYTVGAAAPYIGSGSAPSAYLSGYISNFRVVKGTAVYTANFTPPTAPLTAISGTSLLLNSNSGAFLADNSTNSFTQAATSGTVAWNSASPFTGTGYKNRVYSFTSSGSITF